MLRFAKTVGGLALMVLGLQSASGFSLLGPPNQAWQTSEIGYNLPGPDIGTPHNLGEEFRWNTPVIYYAFNQNFLDYFGSNGVWAVEQAIAVLNGVGNLSSYSADLTEVPLETKRINYRAQSLHLLDLKSAALYFMLEELGLTTPDEYIWTLRTRACPACPVCSYSVIKLSFDPVNWEPSSYINGVLYSYIIREACSGTPTAVTVPFTADPLAVEHLPLMSLDNILTYGLYTTTLTRDDVGGLRYLYRPSNVNWEAMSSDSTLFHTNTATGQQLLSTANLPLLTARSLINNDAALLALYPNLAIVPGSTITSFSNVVTTNFSIYYTNSPFNPAGWPPTGAVQTNYTTNVVTIYTRQFANVFIWTNSLVSYVTVTDTNLTYPPFPGPGYPQIHTTTTTVLTNIPAGAFYLLPGGVNNCGVQITSNVLATPFSLTNRVVVNTPTNSIQTTNLTLLVTSNLTLLTAQSLTNSDAALQALYPGLIIVENSTVPSFTNVITTNLSIYYTNFPTDPIGTAPRGAILTNYTTNVAVIYTRQFANVVIWSNSPVSYVTIIDTNLTYPPFPNPGHLQTNTTTTTVLTNTPAGDYYILNATPTNCGVYILSNVLSTAIGITNRLLVNTPTNAIETTNLALLVTSNYTLLAAQSLTNSDTALQALYPGLVIVPNSMVPSFTNVITTNLSIYFTNSPYDPPGTPPHGAVLTNYTTNIALIYIRQFANVVVWSNSPVSYVTVLETNITYPPFPIAGHLQTNTTTTTVLTNIPSGDYYMLNATPTNCGAYILSNVLSAAFGVTNTLVLNTPTNAIETTNLALQVTSNLTLLAAQSLTNDDAALLALYPGLVIVPNSTVPSFTNLVTTNLSIYFTNYPWDPFGTPPHQVFATNYTTNVQFVYTREFANVVIWSHSPASYVTVIDTNLYFPPFAPFGSPPQTNTTATTMLTNISAGDYYLLPGTPTNCGVYVLSNVLSTVVGVTNTLISLTVPPTLPSGSYLLSRTYINWYTNHSLAYFPVQCVTNVRTRTFINWYTNHNLAYFPVQCVTNVLERTFINWYTNHNLAYFPVQCVTNVLERTYISWFTNYSLAYYPVQCLPNSVTLRQGMDKFTFLRANYDSLVGRFFQPLTNIYSLIEVTNSHPVTNWFQRILTKPDFLYTADDLLNVVATRTVTDGNFNDANKNPGLAGPGNIEPNMAISFNKLGPRLSNVYGTNFIQNGLSERAATTNFMWASFDGSTNDPVIYPNGASIVNLEAQILFQIITPALPDGQVGQAYPATQMQAAGGVLPYSLWTWGNGSPSLPPGLSISPAGLITGTPAVPGTYGLAVSVTGGDARTITRWMSININP